MSAQTAPFGTQDTPLTRVRIIGGKSVRVPEEADFASPYGSPRTGQYGVAKGPHQIIPDQQQPSLQGNIQPQPQSGRYHPNLNQTQSQQAYNPVFLQQDKLFKQLQKQELNHINQESKQRPEPWQQRQQQENQWEEKQHLQMHQLAQPMQTKNVNQNHGRSRSQEWNNHPVLPPIASGDPQLTGYGDNIGGGISKSPQPQPTYQYQSQNFPTENSLDLLFNKLPRDSYLPKTPVRFSKEEELYLRRVTMQGLRDFTTKKLKDLYMDLTSYDKHLTGFIEHHDLSLLLSKYQAYISTKQLRLIASMFVDPKYPGLTNYEKVLSFIDSALKEKTAEASNNRSDGSLSHRSGLDVSPVTHAPVGKMSEGPPPFSSNIEDTKLFRLIQQQLLDYDAQINFESVWQEFRQADRQQRNTLSKDQIKTLSAKCRIPLQESVLSQVIDRCDSNHGQFNWRQYLEFLEKIYPAKTGLKIPVSKKPLEFVKHYPEPSSDWPKVPAKYPDIDLDQPMPQEREPSPEKQLEVMTGRIEKIQDGRAGILPEEVSNANQQPAGLPTDQVELQSNQQREEHIRDLENQLNQLEIDNELARAKAHADRRAQRKQEHSKPWIDRFLKLGQALYQIDPKNTGYVSYYETKWLAHEYNRSWRLDISEGDIDAAIKWSLEGEKVNIDAFVKRLVKLEPQ